MSVTLDLAMVSSMCHQKDKPKKERKKEKLDLMKNLKRMLQRTLLKEENDNSQNGRGYVQIRYWIRDLYLGYKKHSCHSTIF